jgi:hypothetical protein
MFGATNQTINRKGLYSNKAIQLFALALPRHCGLDPQSHGKYLYYELVTILNTARQVYHSLQFRYYSLVSIFVTDWLPF